MYHYMIKLTSRRFFTMDTTDYWPFVQEYSIWNVAVAELQYGQMILILRHSAVPLRGCTQPSSTVTLHSTCDMSKKKYYSVTLWPHWMMPLKGNSHKTSDTKVEVQVFPLLYAKTHDHFMFQHKKIYLLDLPLQEHAHILVASMQHTADWLTKKTMHPH